MGVKLDAVAALESWVSRSSEGVGIAIDSESRGLPRVGIVDIRERKITVRTE